MSLTTTLEDVRKVIETLIEMIDTDESLSQGHGVYNSKEEAALAVRAAKRLRVGEKSEAATTHLCSFQGSPSCWKEREDNERYLCVSDGFVIYCFDVKKSKCGHKRSYFKPLTRAKIRPLKLLKKGLPGSMSLFNFGGDAYMIGGQEFPAHLADLELPRELYDMYDCKGTSRKTYHLCVAARRRRHRLSVFECENIPPLKKPKCWPIVEKIGDRVHVIESIPYCVLRLATNPSHDILDLKKDLVRSSWEQLPWARIPHDEDWGKVIGEHLVVGDRIYVKTSDCGAANHMVFDCKADEWEVHSAGQGLHVIDLLCVGHGVCLGEYPCRRGEDVGRLYMVIGVKEVYSGTIAVVAYLVTETGEVVSTQELPRFFKWLKEPSDLELARLFRVNQQGNTHTVGAVVLGTAEKSGNFLFISTFKVNPIPFQQPGCDFIKARRKEWDVYGVSRGSVMAPWADSMPLRLTACFVPVV